VVSGQDAAASRTAGIMSRSLSPSPECGGGEFELRFLAEQHTPAVGAQCGLNTMARVAGAPPIDMLPLDRAYEPAGRQPTSVHFVTLQDGAATEGSEVTRRGVPTESPSLANPSNIKETEYTRLSDSSASGNLWTVHNHTESSSGTSVQTRLSGISALMSSGSCS